MARQIIKWRYSNLKGNLEEHGHFVSFKVWGWKTKKKKQNKKTKPLNFQLWIDRIWNKEQTKYNLVNGTEILQRKNVVVAQERAGTGVKWRKNEILRKHSWHRPWLSTVQKCRLPAQVLGSAKHTSMGKVSFLFRIWPQNTVLASPWCELASLGVSLLPLLKNKNQLGSGGTRL